MRDGGRLAAAIEILGEVGTRHRPVQIALREWGTAHRFAGSGDRTVIGNLVYDALRHRQSLAWRMASDTPRALILATYALTWENGVEKLVSALETDPHAPEALTPEEHSCLSVEPNEEAGEADAADIPNWLWGAFEEVFGDQAVAEGKSLAARAPIDIRVNTLKSNREKILKRLAHAEAVACGISPDGIRILPRPGAGRMPHVQAEEGYQKGWFELQDEASQIVACLAGARPGEQVLDYCAGGGGKTLALAASMQNKGQIYAYDADRLRLSPIHERLKRAGVHNIQVRDPATAGVSGLEDNMDLVFVDAPCSGTGVWRRRPDSKWKLSEKALADRIEDQKRVLDAACRYVKPGGRLVYVTCSLLPQENSAQVKAFLERSDDFTASPVTEQWQKVFPGKDLPRYQDAHGGIMLTPNTTDTDGFYCAMLTRVS